MKTIHKYHIPNGAEIRMPVWAKLLHVGMQGGEIMLWAEVDTHLPTEVRRFRIIGTGCPVDRGRNYVGTVRDGSFVWHVYEVIGNDNDLRPPDEIEDADSEGVTSP